MKKKTFIHGLPMLLFALVLVLISTNETLWAQCPMCKSALEANLKEGGKHGLGINAGILYLLLLPYLSIAVIGFLWWRKRHGLWVEEEEPA